MAIVVRGAIPALFTPFTPGGETIDEGGLAQHVRWLIAHGVHGLMPCGTTGEVALLTPAERKRVLEVVLEAAAGQVPVIAHIGAASTRETLDLALHAKGCGAQALSAVTPYYHHLTQTELVAHFVRVAEAVADTPLYLYNIPQCTGNALSLETVKAIATHCPNVVGIKDSAGDLASLRRLTQALGESFAVICGSDALMLRALQAGACAVVSSHASVFPEIVVALLRAFWAGDLQQALQEQQRLDHVREITTESGGLALLKRSLALRGLPAGSMRPPLANASCDALAGAAVHLREAGLLV